MTNLYTAVVSLIGGLILFLALFLLPADRAGLLIFALMVVVSELGSVELFHSTRNSTVSVSMIVTMAAVFCLGPSAGVLLQLVTAVTNTFTTHVLRKSQGSAGAASWFHRWAFNTGMFVISTALAGFVFISAGGVVGDLLHLSSIVPLTLAVVTDTLTNVLLLMVIISLQTGTPIAALWREDFRWGVPICILGEAIGGCSLALAYQLNGVVGACVFFVPIFAIGYSFRLYANNMRGAMDRLEQMNQELHENTIELFETLSAVIDAYDIYTLRHSSFVAEYAGAIAEKMDLPPEEKERIIKAALVHDVGKIGISDAIIGKKGPLNSSEYDILKRHPTIGADILGRTKGFQDLVPLVRSHQEKYDGSGYPEGLAGEAIPLGARILTVADSVEAMLSDRAYREGFPISYVMEEVQRCAGKHFDPRVVKAFFEVVEEKGPGFFKNSAHDVDRNVLLQVREHSGEALRFLKRSLVAPSK